MGKLLDLIYPPRCMFCRAFLPAGDDHRKPCADCLRKLPLIPRDQLAVPMGGMTCVSPLMYRGAVPAALRDFKFYSRLSGARFLAALMAAALNSAGQGGFDFVTCAPLGPLRWHKRGYNQSGLLARELADMLGLPCRASLVKIRDTAPQSRLPGGDVRARRLNVGNAYRARPFAKPRIAGANILLVDDIITTGSTALSCAACLRAAGAAEVVCVTAARARAAAAVSDKKGRS